MQIMLGNAVVFEDNTYLNAHGGNIYIGNNVFIGVGSVIQGKGGVTLGDGTLIGPYVQIYSSDHPVDLHGMSRRLMGEIPSPINLGQNVWVGASSIILRGTVIGANSVIAAGSVVRTNSTVAAVFAQRGNLAQQVRAVN
jgi:acetyltransferase-like isoleucine patch superfamily enzyme